MDVVISLKQHAGQPCTALVKPGDRVKKGALIGLPQGLGAKLHASVSGTVFRVDEAIGIRMDEEQPEDFVKIPETSSKLEAIREAGVVGAGGAGFPTHVKLATKIPGGNLIVNAAECEPLLEHNIAFLREDPELIVRGIAHLMEITEAEAAYIAIKPKHREAVRALAEAIKGAEQIRLKFLPDTYPSGDERVIIRELLGELMQPGELPSQYRSVIVNVETLKNCVLAIEQRRPVISKDFTLAGKLAESRVFLDQPIGMPISHYIEGVGGFVTGSGELVIGGPFTGKRAPEEAYLTKISGGVLAAVEFPKDQDAFGLLACECGADESRLREIAESMGGRVVASLNCKRMVERNGRYRCDKPGDCPGQAETVLKLKAKGAKVILAGSCED